MTYTDKVELLDTIQELLQKAINLHGPKATLEQLREVALSEREQARMWARIEGEDE
jgi:hypothetical protein